MAIALIANLCFCSLEAIDLLIMLGLLTWRASKRTSSNNEASWDVAILVIVAAMSTGNGC